MKINIEYMPSLYKFDVYCDHEVEVEYFDTMFGEKSQDVCQLCGAVVEYDELNKEYEEDYGR